MLPRSTRWGCKPRFDMPWHVALLNERTIVVHYIFNPLMWFVLPNYINLRSLQEHSERGNLI